MADDKKSSQMKQEDNSPEFEASEDFVIESINDERAEAPAKNEQAAKELEQAKNDFLYLRAEFDNYRKNAIKERSDLIKYGSERIGRELLEVLDTFDLALGTEVQAENLDSFVKGVEMIATNLKGLLQRFGIQEVNALGESFDPSLHEALSSEPTKEYAPGKICRVYKKGYRLHDRLLRPAQVMVATELPKNSGDDI